MDNMNKTQYFEESRTGYSGEFPKVHLSQGKMDDMDENQSFEESRTRASSYFPEELPMRPSPPPASSASWRKRIRKYFTFSLSSYSIIHTPDGAARVRHMAMVAIVLLRTAMSALSILSEVIKGSISGIVICSLLAVLSLWFTATCLAIIGDAEGNKKMKGITVKRWHFDAFLGICVFIHAGLIVAWCFGLSGWGLEGTSIGMWFAILVVAWIAGWQPKLPMYQKQWAN